MLLYGTAHLMLGKVLREAYFSMFSSTAGPKDCEAQSENTLHSPHLHASCERCLEVL